MKDPKETLPDEYDEFIPEKVPPEFSGDAADAYRTGFALVGGLIELQDIPPKRARHIAQSAISDVQQMKALEESGIDALFTTQN
jgi:hypothetical protein